MGELMDMGMFDFPDDGITPQNPLADLIGAHELHELHGGAPGNPGNPGGLGGLGGGLGSGLTVEYGGREYYVDELNSRDPNAHDPNRAPGQRSGAHSGTHPESHSGATPGSNSSVDPGANPSAGPGSDPGARAWYGSGGVEESVTIADDQGMSILSDTDGDGKVDYVSSVSYDGRWSAWRWIETGEAEGVSERKNSNTPDPGKGRWQTDAWKCVDRGEWG
ncbi:DUF6802 family protein [uncultured Corynebacterium sp.]|uniref:DUF6802 family protein n=1 Tax=uncultured Corynebacterium sp. TaxID=159447 RepID=UPI00262D92A2|nr:DUF6802 family protein [uncultured Corynebacterium sp.]